LRHSAGIISREGLVNFGIPSINQGNKFAMCGWCTHSSVRDRCMRSDFKRSTSSNQQNL